jgi:hypothetical protein
MIRRLILIGGALLLTLASGAYVFATSGPASASAPKFDNSTDTVNCSSFYGSVTISPPLALGGSSPTTIAVKGYLKGCSDATGKVSGSDTSNTAFSGEVKGTVTGASNNITVLAGCSSATGTLTVKWKAYYYNSSLTPPAEKLMYGSTQVSLTQIYGALFSPGSPFGVDNVTTDGYGAFEIGNNATSNGCTAPTYTSPGAFLGTDSGATSASVAITSQDATAILDGQASSATSTKLGLGIGAYYGG